MVIYSTVVGMFPLNIPSPAYDVTYKYDSTNIIKYIISLIVIHIPFYSVVFGSISITITINSIFSMIVISYIVFIDVPLIFDNYSW